MLDYTLMAVDTGAIVGAVVGGIAVLSGAGVALRTRLRRPQAAPPALPPKAQPSPSSGAVTQTKSAPTPQKPAQPQAQAGNIDAEPTTLDRPPGTADHFPGPVEAETGPVEAAAEIVESEAAVIEAEAVAPPAPAGFGSHLARTRQALGRRLAGLRSRGALDPSIWDELEEALLAADVGIATTTLLLDDLRQQAAQGGISSSSELIGELRESLIAIMSEGDHSLHEGSGAANLWLFVGVNGVGKTTTIGKVAYRQLAQGRSVVMAAGDTFRAAAGEQLGMWADRVGAELIRGADGGDPAAVVFDAVQHAAARGVDMVLADTAGRLHTKTNLMDELRKVRRIAERPPAQLQEVLLVLDATTGQNGLVQARSFTEAVGVTGVVLTKLDGTAKGGIAIAVQSELGVPIKLVGLGEAAEDLVDFDAAEFVGAIFDGTDDGGSQGQRSSAGGQS